MAFDYENAVQQGFNRDVETNDWNVEVQNIEIKLGDSGGGTEFRVLDSDNVGVIVGTSDGYLSIAGNAEVHGGNVLVRGESKANEAFVSLEDEVTGIDIHMFNVNPDGTIAGNQGSFGTNYNDGYLYVNSDGAFAWERVAFASQVAALSATTLQQAYDNDDDGGDATITTNALDGDVVIAGSEAFRVTADSGVDVDTVGAVTIAADLDSNFTVDSANLTFEVTSSGDIINRLESPGSDFVVDQGAGSEFLRAETSVNELRLGDLSPEQIDVRVLSDMVIDGDLTVQGTTTTVNTEDLFVEDRLVRLNVGTEPSFSGTTGIEMEVGSDGYVEFHWDDTQGRWEISIDRNVTPEAQTFRPLPYLAEDAATLDLSDIGTGGPEIHNDYSGADMIGTNYTNFETFGGDMFDNTVQSALEAIDAYFSDFSDFINAEVDAVTLQRAYDNDPNGSDATITTNATDGNVVIAGTEAFQVTATGGIDLDSDFDQDGATFDASLSGAFTVNAGASSDITTTAGTVTIDGAGGVVLDGNGSNVIPASDNTDSLGSATNGWTDIYLNNALHGGAVIALSAAGSTTTHNTTAGADLVGTNFENFSLTFGLDMVDNTVQSALEAIDGYLQYLSVGVSQATTLQTAYDNDADGGDATITTNAVDGDVVIAGTEQFRVTADGGMDVDTIGPVSIDADAASNFSTSVGALTLDGAGGVVLDGNGSDVIPATDNTDSLGNATNGWTDIYLNNANHGGTVIALSDAGGTTKHNATAGADLVGTNNLVFTTFGPDMTDDTVQSALEAIDGYLSDLSLENLDTTYKKCLWLDIDGGVKNGVVNVTNISGTPGLAYKEKSTSRTQWTMPVPADWDGLSDIELEVIWSPETADAGDVEWRLEYKSLALTELASSASTNVDYLQTAAGTADELQSTEDNLAISAGDVSLTDDLIVVNLVRRGDAGTDTYPKDANVHLVKVCYVAQNIV